VARIESITEKSQLAPENHALYDRFVQARGRVAGPYSMLLHSPAIADKIDSLSISLRNDSTLSPQEFVLTALAVARAKDCLFVWSVQAPNARRAGVADATIDAIRTGDASSLEPAVADLVAFAQQMVGSNRVDQAVFERLESSRSARWLVELAATAGHFGLISGVNNAFEVPPSEGGDALPVDQA
jgi:4-carboxymuconolactone decarboxylase